MTKKWDIWQYYTDQEAPLLQCSVKGNYKLLGAKEHNVPCLIPLIVTTLSPFASYGILAYSADHATASKHNEHP